MPSHKFSSKSLKSTPTENMRSTLERGRFTMPPDLANLNFIEETNLRAEGSRAISVLATGEIRSIELEDDEIGFMDENLYTLDKQQSTTAIVESKEAKETPIDTKSWEESWVYSLQKQPSAVDDAKYKQEILIDKKKNTLMDNLHRSRHNDEYKQNLRHNRKRSRNVHSSYSMADINPIPENENMADDISFKFTTTYIHANTQTDLSVIPTNLDSMVAYPYLPLYLENALEEDEAPGDVDHEHLKLVQSDQMLLALNQNINHLRLITYIFTFITIFLYIFFSYLAYENLTNPWKTSQTSCFRNSRELEKSQLELFMQFIQRFWNTLWN